MRTALFVATVGYLLCPECKQRITDTKGKERTIHVIDISERWEELKHETWECPHCRAQFKLPSNTFAPKETSA